MCGLFLKLDSRLFNINYYFITLTLQDTCITQNKRIHQPPHLLEKISHFWTYLLLSFLIALFIFIIPYSCCNPSCPRRITSSSCVANRTIKFTQFMSGSWFLQRPALAGHPAAGQCFEYKFQKVAKALQGLLCLCKQIHRSWQFHWNSLILAFDFMWQYHVLLLLLVCGIWWPHLILSIALPKVNPRRGLFSQNN